MNKSKEVINEAVLAQLLQAVKPETLGSTCTAGIRRKVLERIRATRPVMAPQFLTIHASEGTWTVLSPLVEMKVLHRSAADRTKSFLLRLHPGGSLPAHPHHADEECMVLEGEVLLGNTLAHAGDYHLAPKGIAHGVIQSATGALLFLRTGRGEHAAR